MEVYCIFIVEIILIAVLNRILQTSKSYRFLGLFLIVLTFADCQNKSEKPPNIIPDSTLYSSKNFSELVLDSTVLDSFYKKYAVSDSVQHEVQTFYGHRNFQYAWFNQRGVTCAVSTFHARLQNYLQVFEDKSLKNNDLDSLIIFLNANEKQFLSNKKQVQQLELLLTSTYFRFAQKVYGGTSKKTFDLEWFIPRKQKNYQILLDSLVSSAKCERVQEPVNQYYIRLKDKLIQYRAIQRKGGFPVINTSKKEFILGSKDSVLLKVKQHLVLMGDLKINDETIDFTDSLVVAVKQFQKRMGLVESGKINVQTVTELNKPIEFRIKQMMVNLERLRWIPVEMEDNYLLINIPEFRLHIFENQKQVWETNVVVGQTARKTSIFKGNMSQIILNPYWGVPMSIAKNEILSHLKRNPNFLKNNDMEVFLGDKELNPNEINWNKYTSNNLPFNFRQKPGNINALGKMKFMFPNNYHIYLHDTPSKHLFSESQRAFSHGCIRVENPLKLANYLLRNSPNWNPEKVNEILQTDTQTGIRLNPTVPVYIAYFTAWVDSNGQLNFRNDLYHLDTQLAKEVFGDD